MESKISKAALARAARAAGQKTFSAACGKHGETAHYASSKGCVECAREEGAEKVADGRNTEAKRRYYAANLEKCRESGRRRYAANLEKERERAHRSNRANPPGFAARRVKSRLIALGRDWRKQMPELTPGQEDFMRRLYLERNRLNAFEAALPESERMTPRWEVDHILPISKGGRHVPANLQIVPNAVNIAKRDDPALEEQHRQWALFFRFMERRGTLQKWIEAQDIVELDEAA